jgi:hypothetical protein
VLRSSEIRLDVSSKVAQCREIDVELLLQVGAHLSFQLVDLPECKHALSKIHQDLLEYMLSQKSFEVGINTEIDRRCPEDPLAGGKRAFRRCRG